MAKAAKQYIKDEEKRVEAIHLLIEKGVIATWQDIFKYIPRSIVATHLGINNNRMKDLVDDPSPISLIHLSQIAAFLKVRFTVIADLAHKAMPVAKRLKKKN
jgi:hypothetical protein